jgi:hypothetical protein
MEYLGFTVSAGKIPGFHKESRGRYKLASAYDTEGGSLFRTILQLLCHMNSLFQRPYAAPLTDLLQKSQPEKVTLTPACLEAFDTLKLRSTYSGKLFATTTQGRDASTHRTVYNTTLRQRRHGVSYHIKPFVKRTAQHETQRPTA